MGDSDSSPFNGDVYPRIWFAGGLPPEGEPVTSDMPLDRSEDDISMKNASSRRADETKNAGGYERNGAESAEKPDAQTDNKTLPGDDEPPTAASTEEDGEEEQRLVIDFDDGSFVVDSELDAKRRKRKSFRPQKYHPGTRQEAPQAHAAGQDHLSGETVAQTSVEGWKASSDFERQREYNREYKRKRRSNPEVRAKERERQKEYQRLRRSDPTFVAMEKQKRKNRQQEKSSDPDQLEKRRARQREYARARRANPEYAAREREKNRLYQKQRREDPVFVIQEREKQRQRLEQLRQKRSDPEFAAKERERNREYQRQKRLDLEFVAKEREKRKERKEKLQTNSDLQTQHEIVNVQMEKQPNVLTPDETKSLNETTHRSEIVVHPMTYDPPVIVEGELAITYETSDVIVESSNQENSATTTHAGGHHNEQLEVTECKHNEVSNRNVQHKSNASLSDNPNDIVPLSVSHEHLKADSNETSMERLKEMAVQGLVEMDQNASKVTS